MKMSIRGGSILESLVCGGGKAGGLIGFTVSVAVRGRGNFLCSRQGVRGWRGGGARYSRSFAVNFTSCLRSIRKARLIKKKMTGGATSRGGGARKERHEKKSDDKKQNISIAPSKKRKGAESLEQQAWKKGREAREHGKDG